MMSLQAGPRCSIHSLAIRPPNCHTTVALWARSWVSPQHTSPTARHVCSATASTIDADVKRALEKAERARSSWAVEVTDFYPPPVIAEVQRTTKLWSDIVVQCWGGYAQAERCRLLFGREEIMHTAAADSSTVVAINVHGNFMFDAASHRDFLGSSLGTGIERRTIGDVLVQRDTGAQILCTPEIAEFLTLSLDQVRSVPVQATLLELGDLRVPTPKVNEIKCIEASMRVDAVASAGFRMSRSKFAEMVKKGDVRVNWLSCNKPSVILESGDVISVAGKGRMTVGSVTTTTKGKFVVELTVNL